MSEHQVVGGAVEMRACYLLAGADGQAKATWLFARSWLSGGRPNSSPGSDEVRCFAVVGYAHKKLAFHSPPAGRNGPSRARKMIQHHAVTRNRVAQFFPLVAGREPPARRSIPPTAPIQHPFISIAANTSKKRFCCLVSPPWC